MTKRRYPGVSPFTSDQKNIFFGRDNNIKKLQKLISLRKQVLLYSKSGIGKTSLLNAGVLPNFEDKFTIIKIRFFAYNNEKPESPIKKIVNAIKLCTDTPGRLLRRDTPGRLLRTDTPGRVSTTQKNSKIYRRPINTK